jgi:hypothetical protein
MLEEIFRRPLLLFAVSLVVLSMATWAGVALLTRLRAQVVDMRDDVRTVAGATLTLLALLIGFSFSMAVSRYDQRKNLEEGEANAIGTEYVRADLLPAADAARVRALLAKYLDVRIRFYVASDIEELKAIDAQTAQLQGSLWSAAQVPASARPDPVVALAVAGMNDVLNSQGYTQAAWLNRIPLAAWILMTVIAICATLLAGFGATSAKALPRVLLMLPLMLSFAFYLIADIDAPRRGLIAVKPQNLLLLSNSLRETPAKSTPTTQRPMSSTWSRYSPYPSASISSRGMKRSDAELMQ